MSDWAWADYGDDRITVHSDKEGASFDLTGRAFGVSAATICNVVHRKAWRDA